MVSLPLQGGATSSFAGAAATPVVLTGGHHVAEAAAHCAPSVHDHASAPHGKCSHSAGCCVGAAAPPTVPVLAMPAMPARFAGASIEPAMTAPIAATLERPPRVLS